MFNYPFLTYNSFTTDKLRHTVTLTFDPLSLNVCSAWVVQVIKLYQIRLKSNITRWSYCELKIDNLAPPAVLNWTGSGFSDPAASPDL